MRLNDICKTTHEYVKSKGFWKNPRTLPELLCLIHAEVSEALEEVRAGHAPNETYYSGKVLVPEWPYNVKYYESMECEYPTDIETSYSSIKVHKPEGVPSELADIILRVCDLAGYYGIDLEAIINEKMAYNETRGYMHGGKKL